MDFCWCYKLLPIKKLLLLLVIFRQLVYFSWCILVLRNLAYKHIACLRRVESLRSTIESKSFWFDLLKWRCWQLLDPKGALFLGILSQEHSQVQAPAVDSSKWIICFVVEAPRGRWAGWFIGILLNCFLSLCYLDQETEGGFSLKFWFDARFA